jgi:malonate-semialdehyde dehydrogenase (acetylating)/methylmalonate-semialdehyde dehydrogenase
MSAIPKLRNFVGGKWRDARTGDFLDVDNPATGEVIAKVPLSNAEDVGDACEIAGKAKRDWRNTPVPERIQPLFKLKDLMEAHIEELATLITNECGKTFVESVAELRRGIENVESACGMPSLMQGDNNEDIARGIDEHMIRQPLGVVAGITPFNFPGMIPLWFMPWALATGNCFVLKPSSKVPMTMSRFFELLEEADFPPGVVQLINGSGRLGDAFMDHPEIKAVSFVGSTRIAQYLYERCARNGKRAQAQGGAKNCTVIMPDADMETTVKIVADSAFGCAGQRCLANALAIPVGAAREPFTEAFVEAAAKRRVGYGMEKETQMGPVISPNAKESMLGYIERAERDGAKLIVDGRGKGVEGYPGGNWLYPTVFDDVKPEMEMACDEIFGPVFGLIHAETLDEAIDVINNQTYGNMATIFTSSGGAARTFRHDAEAGNIGINIGVAAPMAFYPFSGWKASFFGDLHGQAKHAVEFFTRTKVVVERWSRGWARKF